MEPNDVSAVGAIRLEAKLERYENAQDGDELSREPDSVQVEHVWTDRDGQPLTDPAILEALESTYQAKARGES